MAWNVNGTNLQMTEGDYGVELPVTVTGTTLGQYDSIKFTFKTARNGETVLEKSFTNITNNTVNLVFDESDSAKLPAGIYAYSMDWYQSGYFLCNIIPNASLKVVDKA